MLTHTICTLCKVLSCKRPNESWQIFVGKKLPSFALRSFTISVKCFTISDNRLKCISCQKLPNKATSLPFVFVLMGDSRF